MPQRAEAGSESPHRPLGHVRGLTPAMAAAEGCGDVEEARGAGLFAEGRRVGRRGYAAVSQVAPDVPPPLSLPPSGGVVPGGPPKRGPKPRPPGPGKVPLTMLSMALCSRS